jgi:hypothetical protein
MRGFALDISALAHSFAKAGDEGVWLRFSRHPKYGMCLRGGLPRCRARPCRRCRAAKNGDELSPLHCLVPSRAFDRKDSTPRYGRKTTALRHYKPAMSQSVVSTFMIWKDIRAGHLIHVLPQWQRAAASSMRYFRRDRACSRPPAAARFSRSGVRRRASTDRDIMP